MKAFRKAAIAITSALVLISVPALAVFNEKDLGKTISVLRYELQQENQRMENARQNIRTRNNRQHNRLVDMLKKSNELSLILYSQKQDYTFDMTYALKEVTREYEDFNEHKLPFDDIVARLNMEIERYEHLVEALRRLPPVLDEVAEVPDSISISKDSLMMSFGGGMHDERHHHHIGGSEAEHKLEHMAGMPPREDHGGAFMLDEQGQADRDSCMLYARNLLRMYTQSRDKIVIDSEHYTETSERLKETYDYAQNRYREVQKKIFFTGQDSYFKVLSTMKRYSKQAWREASEKYGVGKKSQDRLFPAPHSDWRGPVVVGFIFFVLIFILAATILSNIIVGVLMKKVKALQDPEFKKKRSLITLLCGMAIFSLTIMIAPKFSSQNFFVLASNLLMVFAWLVTAILLSLVIRLNGDQARKGAGIYWPVIIMGLVVITFRILFIPNKLLNLVYPPLLLLVFIWQLILCGKKRKYVNKSDMYYAWITVVITLVATCMAWYGYVLMSVQVYIWWLFQLASLQTITAIYDILASYERKRLAHKMEVYRRSGNMAIDANQKDAFIAVTWIFDLVKKALMPVLAICTVPFSLYLAADVFDLTSVCKTLLYKPFVNLTSAAGQDVLHLSLFKILLVAALYFVFNYVCYLTKALYKLYKYQSVMNQSGQDFVHPNQVNLTLANNLIVILIWGVYIVIAVLLLKIPMGALSVIAAGLATGIGLALKDVLNNFIYGIQLMSGRLQVGDYVECDGVRGKVESISYQSTQIITLESAVMSITNTSLFNKNFKNLTRNSAYECVKIPVGVRYGVNVDDVRYMLLDALKQLQVKDLYGRDIVDSSNGVTVAFSDFGDSSVDLIVKQYVLVEEEIAYIAKAKEIIYDTLNANNVEIPFPQRDVYIRKVEE